MSIFSMTKARRAALDFFILDVCIDVKLPWLAMSSSHYICITYNAPYVQCTTYESPTYVHCTAVGKSNWALGSSQQPPAAIEQSHWAAWALVGSQKLAVLRLTAWLSWLPDWRLSLVQPAAKEEKRWMAMFFCFVEFFYKLRVGKFPFREFPILWESCTI